MCVLTHMLAFPSANIIHLNSSLWEVVPFGEVIPQQYLMHTCVPGAGGGSRAQSRRVQPGTKELIFWNDLKRCSPAVRTSQFRNLWSAVLTSLRLLG